MSRTKRRQLVIFCGIALSGIIVFVKCMQENRVIENIDKFDSSEYEVSTEPGYPCVGYSPSRKSWQITTREICPAGYGIMASDSFGPYRFGPPGYVSLNPHCCRLPFDDILTDKHIVNIIEKCPEGTIMTSGMDICGAHCTVRCTYINTDKYYLGPEKPAIYVEDPEEEGVGGQGSSKKIMLNLVPAALRDVVTRWTFTEFGTDGCVGDPYGSLLVRKSQRQCSGMFYRQLFYKDGTPVPVLPHCDKISDAYDPNAKCLVKRKKPGNAAENTRKPTVPLD